MCLSLRCTLAHTGVHDVANAECFKRFFQHQLAQQGGFRHAGVVDQGVNQLGFVVVQIDGGVALTDATGVLVHDGVPYAEARTTG